MFVTTGGRTTEEYINKAKQVATDLQVPYVPRRKQSIQALQQQFNPLMVVGKEGIRLYHKEAKEPYFFHPNLAMIRIKRLMNEEHDTFIEFAQLQQGDTLVDCTLGYASDSVVASYVVGETGKVIGIEASRVLAYLTKLGLQSWDAKNQDIQAAMQRVEVVGASHDDFLRSLPSKSVDVVYFDPMFEESIDGSTAIQALSPYTVYSQLTEEIIAEAKRVARKKVILKDHYRSERFQQLGFTQHIRKTAKFHFGTIDL